MFTQKILLSLPTFSIKNIIVFLLTPFFICALSTTTFAEELTSFNIPKQAANTALISYAEQADTTIIFSFNLTKEYSANKLVGFYPKDYALTKLLRNSGLVATVSKNGQIKVEKSAQISSKKVKANATTQYIERAQKTEPPVLQNNIEKISVLGSRGVTRTIDSLPVPVDVFSNEALNSTGHYEVGKILQTLAPSFNISTSAISDGSDVLQPATLRGLGPDQTLVLVNGKRRHQASLIHINNSVGRGTAGVDMNAIPLESIAYIEVLRDGAAAQYGSDAIAGVINIVLKGKHDTGKVSLSAGTYSRGDGETIKLGISKGLIISDDTFINTTLSIKEHNGTNRSGRHGTCQYQGCVELPNGDFLATDPREINASRNTFNVGDAFYNQVAFTANGEHKTSYGKLYSFFTYSNRENESAAFFRHNADINANVMLQDGDATIPQGFLPKIESKISDISFNLGTDIKLPNDALLDLSYTFGKNNIDYHVKDSINSSYVNAWLHQTDKTAETIRQDLPLNANAYGLKLSLETLNLNYTQHFQNTSLSLGLEHRIDHYCVIPGDEYAYADYDTITGNNLFNTDFVGGIQGFPGIPPELSVDERRRTTSLYAELNANVTDNINIIGALRYDNSQSFGHANNVKLAANWEGSEVLTFRGNISTGFRAPSMQQLYFNNNSTQFIVNNDNVLVPEVVKTYRNDSEVAQSLGIKTLTPEDAKNFSLGVIYQPYNSLNVALDYYHVNIKNRIVMSTKISNTRLSKHRTLANNQITKGQFFLNGAESTTEGIDLVATWKSTALQADNLTITMAGNVTKTNVNHLYPLYSDEQGYISINQLYSAEDIAIIEEWQPKSRFHLSSLYQKNDWEMNLAFNHYGKYTITDGERQTYSPKLVTDIKLSYKLTNATYIFVGSNNLFDVAPDKNTIGNSRAGTIVDNNGNVIVESAGVFKYSRRSAPFGYNGAYYYAGIDYQF